MITEEELEEMAAKRLASAKEALEAVHAQMPWGDTLALPDGRVLRWSPLAGVKTEDDGAVRFLFDLVFEDGGHIEFMVKQTGWGSVFKQKGH